MPPQISSATFSFLRQLKRNNNREWFQDNKQRYQLAHLEFVEFVDALIESIGSFDPSVLHHTGKSVAFRIYRDVRFSKDKSPYKTNFGAHITGAGKRSEVHSRAGYYLHIEPGASMLAGGAYLPRGPWLSGIRNAIAAEPKKLRKIIGAAPFKKYFGEIEGEKLKTSPRGFNDDHPAIDLLRFKSFLATHHMKDAEVKDKGFLAHAKRVYKALVPFDTYLNDAAP